MSEGGREGDRERRRKLIRSPQLLHLAVQAGTLLIYADSVLLHDVLGTSEFV